MVRSAPARAIDVSASSAGPLLVQPARRVYLSISTVMADLRQPLLGLDARRARYAIASGAARPAGRLHLAAQRSVHGAVCSRCQPSALRRRLPVQVSGL